MNELKNPSSTSSRPKSIWRRKRAWIAFTFVGVLTTAGVIRAQIISAFQDDACQQISMAVSEKIEQRGPVTPELQNDAISFLIRASVINGQIDPNGNPRDYNGNAFEVNVSDGIVTTSTKPSFFHPFASRGTCKVGE